MTWINYDSDPHTVTSTSQTEPFNSGDIAPGRLIHIHLLADGYVLLRVGELPLDERHRDSREREQWDLDYRLEVDIGNPNAPSHSQPEDVTQRHLRLQQERPL